jgi:uncharacterized protein (DUF885 family)
VKGTALTSTDQLADELTDAVFDANPVEATMLGIRDRDDRVPDFSEAGEEASRDRVAGILARADGVVAAGDEDRVTLAVARSVAEEVLDRLAVRAVEYAVTDTFTAPAIGLLMLMPMTGIAQPAHADGYLARLAGLPGAFGAIADRHRTGIAAGRPAPRSATSTGTSPTRRQTRCAGPSHR